MVNTHLQGIFFVLLETVDFWSEVFLVTVGLKAQFPMLYTIALTMQ